MQQPTTEQYCIDMYCFYDRLLQQPNQSANCKAFRLERQNHYAELYCLLTQTDLPIPQ